MDNGVIKSYFLRGGFFPFMIFAIKIIYTNDETYELLLNILEENKRDFKKYY